jgi:hypothetical protein
MDAQKGRCAPDAEGRRKNSESTAHRTASKKKGTENRK